MAAQGRTLDALANDMKAVKDTQATQGRTQGALAEKVVLLERFVTGEDKEPRRGVEINTGDSPEPLQAPMSAAAALLGLPRCIGGRALGSVPLGSTTLRVSEYGIR